jgi:uncharacterized membrane protein YkvA (DUF1232 family)
MPEIVKYVSHGARHITPAIMEKVLRQLPRWKVEFTQILAPQFPHLINQLEFLAEAAEDFAEGADKDLPYVAVSEAVFALMYAHKRMDIIPDFINTMGHADDSSIVRAVLIQNEKAFGHYASRRGRNWAKISSNP